MADQHRARVRRVTEALTAAAHAGEQVHLSKAGGHHVVPLPGDPRFQRRAIDTSELCNLVQIDVDVRRCVAEPGLTFEDLVRATLRYGLIPAVVPELRGITVGGAIAGCSVESMSHAVGGFHDTCLEYEVIATDGTLHRVSREHRPDLFEHLHGSYGTLGVLSEVTFTLVPAGPFVEMTYQHFHDVASFAEAARVACAPVDDGAEIPLVDAIVHGPRHLTLCVGRFVDDPGDPTPSDYTAEHVYYRSTERLRRDVMTTEQYCFRYDADCHWLTATAPPLQWAPLRRVVAKRVLGSTNLIRWANRLGPVSARVFRRPDVVCDIFIPHQRFEEFWGWYCRTFDFWPLWVIPYRIPEPYPWLGPAIRPTVEPGALFFDCAVYGKRNTELARDYSQLLEEETFRLGGIKTLIGRSHYDRERFWEIYDEPAYLAAKAELDPHGVFPNLYDKLGRVE